MTSNILEFITRNNTGRISLVHDRYCHEFTVRPCSGYMYERGDCYGHNRVQTCELDRFELRGNMLQLTISRRWVYINDVLVDYVTDRDSIEVNLPSGAWFNEGDDSVYPVLRTGDWRIIFK